MHLFLTGDRGMPAELALTTVAIELLRAAKNGDTVCTGNAPGVEQAVRSIAQDVGFEVQVFETPALDEVSASMSNTPWDFVKRHENSGADAAIVIHGEPSTSKMLEQLAGADITVRIVAPSVVVLAV